MLKNFELRGGVDKLLVDFGSAQSLFAVDRSLQLLVLLDSFVGQLALLFYFSRQFTTLLKYVSVLFRQYFSQQVFVLGQLTHQVCLLLKIRFLSRFCGSVNCLSLQFFNPLQQILHLNALTHHSLIKRVERCRVERVLSRAAGRVAMVRRVSIDKFFILFIGWNH